MDNINDFSNLRSLIIDRYNELKTSGLIPVKVHDIVIDEKFIDDAVENLNAKKFIVSVCGQIKAGKSFLLNDIIFGDDILPTADTPETAKIASISYGEKPEYAVYFYTPDEWELLKNSPVNENGVSGTYYNIVIKPAFEALLKSTGRAPDENEILTRGSMSGEDLKDLDSFISVKGHYTIFVKSIQIKYPADILKTITIIDTPGINDPNIFRSRITEKWIGRSDAVIFLLSAAQPFTAQDRDFFEKYLLPVPLSKILMVVSKIDLAEDPAQVKNFVSQSIKKVLGAPGEALLENREIQPIAPMFSLFKKMKAASTAGKLKLSQARLEEIDYQLSDRAKSTAALRTISENNGYMQDFIKLLEKTLTSQNGRAMMDGHVKHIEAVYEYRIKNLETEAAALTSEIETLKAEEIKLGSNVEKNSADREKVLKTKKSIEAEIDKFTLFLNENIESAVVKSHDELIRERGKDAVKSLTANLSFDALTKIKKCTAELNAKFSELLESFKGKLPGLVKNLSWHDNNIDALVKNIGGQLFNDIDVGALESELKNKINSELSPEKLKARLLYWLFFWVDDAGSRAGISEAAKKIFITDGGMRHLMMNAFNGVINGIKNRLGQLFLKIDGISSACAAAVESGSREISANKAKSQELSAKLAGLLKRIGALEIRLDEVKAELNSK